MTFAVGVRGKKMDEITLTLNNPITEEQWDLITDVDMECTERIWFHTKHGKEVEFVKRKTGNWIDENCSECGQYVYRGDARNFCPNCGADMRGDKNVD